MNQTTRAEYSYRDDSLVPRFLDDKPVFVFDGVCVLCSAGAAWLMRHDRRDLFRFASAQSSLGQALYAHYGLPLDESYLLIDRGRVYEKSTGYLRMAALLGGLWTIWRVFSIVPRPIRDFVYDIVARNRYRWFGKTEHCALIPSDHTNKLL